MKFKSILIIYLVQHVLLFIVALLTTDINSNCVGAFLVYFCLAIYCVKKFNDNKPTYKLLFTLILLRLLLFGGYNLYLCLTEELYGSPVLIIHLLGILSGFFYLRLKRPFNFMPAAFSCVFLVFMFFSGWDLYYHKKAYQTFTGRIEPYKSQQKIEGIDRNNNLINNQSFENKIALLDFWYTRCGDCFEKFPQLQAFYDKYKDDDSIAVCAINKPIEEDKPNELFQLTEKYTFPVLLPADEELPEKFDIQGYPTTLVIDRSGMVVYKGGIEGAVKTVENLKNQRD
jgi:thiol-disulfide isomerase/thioredoxin